MSSVRNKLKLSINIFLNEVRNIEMITKTDKSEKTEESKEI